jgi:hypothetical protein
MKCLGCNGIFKTETGLIRHLSSKLYCQNAMGMSIPATQPPKQTLTLDHPPIKTNANKKRPAAPQLSHGLVPPPSSKGRTSSHPFSTIEGPIELSQNLQGSQQRLPSMDSHALHSMLTGILTDKALQYNQLVQTRYPHAESGLEDPTQFPSEDGDLSEGAAEDQEEINNPFANDIFDVPHTGNTETVFHETNNAFADRFDGAFSQGEKLCVRLLAILRRIGAPNYVYGEIMDIMDDALRHNVTLTSTFRDRTLALNHLAQRFSMQPLFPKVDSIASPDGRVFPLITHRAKSMIQSLLTSPLMEDDNNLLFPNLADPLAPPPDLVNTLADIDTGRSYRNAYNLLCRGRPRHILCGIILYIDKLAVDRHGHLSLEPVYFTLSIFNQKTRNKPEAWRPLGYIPNLSLQSKAESRHSMLSSQKVQLYHDILGRILHPLCQVQQDAPMPFHLSYRDQQFDVLLKFPLLAILGDTESHDRLSTRQLPVHGMARRCLQ